MPRPIENLTIHAFRGLRELELQGLGRINLLVGPNNSGKTSVLEAIATFCRPLDVLEWVGAARRREVKSSRAPVQESLSWLFPRGQTTRSSDLFYGEASVSAQGGSFPVIESLAVCEEMIPTDETESRISEDENEEESDSAYSAGLPTMVTELRLSAKVRAETALQFGADPATGALSRKYDVWPNSRFSKSDETGAPALRVHTVSAIAHRVEVLQARELSLITLAEHKPMVLELMRMFDESITGLDILTSKFGYPTVYLHQERMGFSPLASWGDGMRRALVMGMSLLSARGGVLLVDEIETAIHTSVLDTVFQWLVQACIEFDVQLLATTHSLEAVDAMFSGGKVDLGEVAGYHLESAPEKTIARRYPGELLRRLRLERGLDVR